jgi:hypothetical protein
VRRHGRAQALAKSVQAKPSKNRAEPRKKALDFLGFVHPKRDFSMSYIESK